MRFVFRTQKLEALYYDEKGARDYPKAVVQAFFEVMAIIEAATNEADIRAFKGLRFERLKGRRGKAGERSLRLNRQYRLIVAIEEDQQGNFVCIISISKHYD